MQRQTAQNTFSAGMAADIDKHLQKANTYRYARNGRLVFNREADKSVSLKEAVLNGHSFVLSSIQGNSFAADFCEGYDLIGSIVTSRGTVVFLTDDFHSEIGLLTVDNPADVNGTSYHTLYNDRNDPNVFNNPYARHTPGAMGGDRLMLEKKSPIHGYSVYENEFTERVYWADAKNQKRTFNLNDFYTDKECTIPYHTKNLPCFAPVVYPRWMSAHAMDEQPDCVMPIVRFRKRIEGKLKTGAYQLVVRYKSRAGAVSPFSRLTNRVFVTNFALDGSTSAETSALRSNHHNRVMADKNDIVTNEGLRFDLTRIDTRWDELEIGYVYHTEETSMREAYIFKRLKLDNNSSRTIDLVSHNSSGNDILMPITADELNQVFATVLSVGTTIEYQNRNFDANIKLLPDIKLDLSSASIAPEYKYFREDETLEPVFNAVDNPVTKRKDNDPLTNSSVTTAVISTSRFTGETDSYTVDNDYLNAKGQQVDSNFRGYFRGETYPVGAMAIDRKGNPLFVDPIMDYTTPQQYDNYPNNTLTRKNADGKYDLRSMGLRVSGIRIRKENLFDEQGRLNLSGFMVVRGQRTGTIKCQGYLFPTLQSPNCNTSTENDGYIRPMGFPDNLFDINYMNASRGDAHRWRSGMAQCKDKWYDFTFGPDPLIPTASAPYVFNFHSPDLLIEETLREINGGDKFHHIGQAHRAYTKGSIELAGNNLHLYTKNYRSDLLQFANTALDNQYIQNGRPQVGSKTRIKYAKRHTLKEEPLYAKFDPDYYTYDYSAISDNVKKFNDAEPESQCGWLGFQQPNSVIVRCLDWESVDLAESTNPSGLDTCSYRAVNWLQSESNTDTAPRRWVSTGHYQPITLDVLERAQKEYDTNGNVVAYRFDDIEVWGGDAYVNLFDFSRLYPNIDKCEKICRNLFGGSGRYYDTACSHILPIESKYNLALRYGRKFAANATNPLKTSCDGADLQFSNGIMPRQSEDWNYNRVLLLHESTQFHFSRLEDVRLTQNRPNGLMWSPVKTYGERYDSYRTKLALDYKDLPGEYGPVVKLLKHFDYVYFIQKKAFGVLLLNTNTFINGDTGEITVASGQVFNGQKYISNKYGTNYPQSIWEAENRFGFVDVLKGEVISFGQEGRNLLAEDNQLDDLIARTTIYYPTAPNRPATNVICGYDQDNKEVLFTFRYDVSGTKDAWDRQMTSFTLNYSYILSCFVSYLDVLPDIYVNIDRYLYSFKRGKGLYLHNFGRYGSWYGQYYDFVVRSIVNPMPNVRKVYNNGHLSVSESATKRLKRVWHRAESGEHTLNYVGRVNLTLPILDDRFEYWEGLLSYPMHEEDMADLLPRLKGQILEVEWVFDNSYQLADNKNLPVLLRSLDTGYRITHPVQY